MKKQKNDAPPYTMARMSSPHLKCCINVGFREVQKNKLHFFERGASLTFLPPRKELRSPFNQVPYAAFSFD